MLKAPSKPKNTVGLTIMQATTRARRAVDRVMPAAATTVGSRYSHDLQADAPLVITTVTFPRGHEGASALAEALGEFGHIEIFNTHIVITRKR